MSMTKALSIITSEDKDIFFLSYQSPGKGQKKRKDKGDKRIPILKKVEKQKSLTEESVPQLTLFSNP